MSRTRPPPPSSPLFPYTTLFRSAAIPSKPHAGKCHSPYVSPQLNSTLTMSTMMNVTAGVSVSPAPRRHVLARNRSEEHTSELQSLRHLVCRLLLEKKKT